MAIRLTDKRNRILAVLKKQPKALSAKEVYEAVSDIDLVTVYRTLALFTKEKMISEVHLGTDETRYEYQHEPHHHAVCDECEQVIHFTAPDKKIKELLGLKNFSIEALEVTVRGRHTTH